MLTSELEYTYNGQGRSYPEQGTLKEIGAQEPVSGGPERIWAWEGDGQDGWENAYATLTCVAADQVEYIRADLAHPATPAPVEAGLRDDTDLRAVLRLRDGTIKSLMAQNDALRAQSDQVGGEVKG